MHAITSDPSHSIKQHAPALQNLLNDKRNRVLFVPKHRIEASALPDEVRSTVISIAVLAKWQDAPIIQRSMHVFVDSKAA